MLRLAQRALVRFRTLSAGWRTFIEYALDATAWVLAVAVALFVRFDFTLELVPWRAVVVVGLALALVQFVAGWAVHLYRGRHFNGSFGQFRALLSALVVTTMVVGLPVILFGNAVLAPRSTVILAFPIAFMLAAGIRYLARLVGDQMARPSDGAQPTLVYGAGYLGSTLVRRMLTDRHSQFLPIGIIDDSPLRARAWIDGVRVLGTGKQLIEIAERTGAKAIVVAIARADSAMLRWIADQARAAKLTMKVLPPLEEVLEGRSRLRDLRDVSIEDLIGRQVVDTDVESVAGYLAGKRVLVTGAGGSIGSELCRQIHKFHPAELIMLDHDETGLQSTQLSIHGNGLLETRDVVLASIRDADTLARVFADRRPEVVFHAAALKHLPLLEQYPDEGWETNVLGTRNVLEASMSVGVETFINISTDKAADPTSVLGHSKRIAEQLTAGAAEKSEARYLSVRFGNVLGSRGSMLPVFASLIEAGGPVTITHPEVTRYFMTIPEACQLVVQAGGIGHPGEVLILDMGEPVRILDIAERMIDMSGEDIAIVYTGLRPGEKLHEVLVDNGELDHRPVHPKISHTRTASIATEHLDKTLWLEQRAAVGDAVGGAR